VQRRDASAFQRLKARPLLSSRYGSCRRCCSVGAELGANRLADEHTMQCPPLPIWSRAADMGDHTFFAELRRRNVYKVAVAYVVVGWLLIQIATQVFPFLQIPTWAIRLVIALVALGFPIALVIAWAFEATPEGIKRTETFDVSGERAPKT
jgi:hypothetical protein